MVGMETPENARNRDFWLARADAVKRRVNLAWWVETLSAPLLVFSLISAAALLWARREMAGFDPLAAAACVAATLLGIGLACLALARRKFEMREQSLVRIEATMRLRNALSAASEGVTPWPAPLSQVDAGLHWRWPRLLVPMLGSLAMLGAGLWIPVSAKQPGAQGSANEPQAWKQLSSELDMLAKEEVVDEKYLEETRKRLEELKSQEEDQWFSHSSLEATDSLKKSHQSEAERVEREVGKAEKALESLEKNSAQMNQADKDRLMEDFDQALKGLQNGAMKPNPQLLEQMKGMDLKNLADLPPDQLEQLKKNLNKHGKCMGQCEGGGEGNEWDEDLMSDEQEGNGKDGQQGPGSGGIQRGPGHDPNVLGREKDAVETGNLEGLAAKDLSNAAPGDLLELQDGEHDIDKNASSLRAGGETSATGKGGDRVWKESLDPDEQRALKKFFE